MRDVVASPRFAFAELALVSICGVIWYTWPQVGKWLLLIALLPWIVRVFFGSFPFRRTALDLVLVVFLVTAGIGLWATYDRTAGWAKFWIIIAAILLFYALAGQPRGNLWLVAGLLCGFGAILAGYFLLIYDWSVKPADINALTWLGLWWMRIRPTILASGLHPNIAGGILAAVLPFTIALGILARRKNNWPLGLFAIFTGVWILVGLLLASSRLAWLVLARYILFAIGLFLGLVLVYWLVTLTPGGFIGFLDQLPGSDNANSRLVVIRDSIKLVPDFPYTGGGLAALPGLYSHYIRIVSHYTINNSHNLFLNIALEQGLFGLAAFLCILLFSFWSLKTSQFDEYFRWAVLAGLLVVILNGLADDPFYGGRATPLLLFLPGLAIAVARVKTESEDDQPRVQAGGRVWGRWGIILGVLLLLTILAFAFRKQLVAQWYANLGAVHMAKYELADFPIGEWDERQELEPLRPAYDFFIQSIEQNPLNFTAQHRMGLIAMRVRDFDAAVSHLERASMVDPEHRGLRKVLGYSYVWNGQFEKAVPLMVNIPLIKGEFRSYRSLWKEQERGDLFAQTVRMLDIFNEIENGSAQ
jgi:tetratricopeptide (TPR) repeat protein